MNLYFNKMLDDGFQLFHYNNFIKAFYLKKMKYQFQKEK